MNKKGHKEIEVSYKLPFFRGHFPENPILPGVLLLQWAEEIIRRSDKEINLKELKSAKFTQVILPNDIIIINWEYINDSKISVKIIRDTDICAKLEFTYSKP